MVRLHSGVSERGLNPYRSDALSGQASLYIAAINTIGRQIAIAVGRPGKIDGAGRLIRDGDQPLGNSRRKHVGGRHLDGLAWHTLNLHRSSGKVDGCDSFYYIAVPLVEERGGIDRVARVFPVRSVDDEGLRRGW
jgi:hypothetical protein